MKSIFLASFTVLVISLISSCGNNPTPNESPATPAAAHATGADIYNRTCVTCHQANGEGLPNTFPPLAKSDFLADKEKTIMQVLKGFTGELVVNGKKFNSTMPAQQLNDEEIAAVLTYVYGNFGNSGGTVTPADVKAVRGKL